MDAEISDEGQRYMDRLFSMIILVMVKENSNRLLKLPWLHCLICNLNYWLPLRVEWNR